MDKYESSVLRDATLEGAPKLPGVGFPDLTALAPSYDARKANSGGSATSSARNALGVASVGTARHQDFAVDVPHVHKVLSKVRTELASQTKETQRCQVLRMKEQMLLLFLRKVAKVPREEVPINLHREMVEERKRSTKLKSAPPTVVSPSLRVAQLERARNTNKRKQLDQRGMKSGNMGNEVDVLTPQTLELIKKSNKGTGDVPHDDGIVGPERVDKTVLMARHKRLSRKRRRSVMEHKAMEEGRPLDRPFNVGEDENEKDIEMDKEESIVLRKRRQQRNEWKKRRRGQDVTMKRNNDDNNDDDDDKNDDDNDHRGDMDVDLGDNDQERELGDDSTVVDLIEDQPITDHQEAKEQILEETPIEGTEQSEKQSVPEPAEVVAEATTEASAAIATSLSTTCPLCGVTVSVSTQKDIDEALSVHMSTCQQQGDGGHQRRRSSRRTKRPPPSYNEAELQDSINGISDEEDGTNQERGRKTTTRKTADNRHDQSIHPPHRTARSVTRSTKSKPKPKAKPKRKPTDETSSVTQNPPIRTLQSDALDDYEDWVYEDRVDEWMESGLTAMKKMAEQDDTEEPPGAKIYPGDLLIPAWVNNRLFGYQRTGIRWMWELHRQEAGGIVGDEMGLGKVRRSFWP